MVMSVTKVGIHAHEFPLPTATIASSGTTSSEVDLRGYVLCGFHMPSAFTGTTLKISAATATGGTFNNIYDSATSADYSLNVAASKYVPITNLAYTAGIRFIKVISGSSEASDRTITLAVRPVS